MTNEKLKIGQRLRIPGSGVWEIIDCFISTTTNTLVWKISRGSISRFVYALEVLPYAIVEKVKD